MMSQFVSDDDDNDENCSSESGHGRSATDSLLESTTTNQPNSGDYRLSNFVSSNVVAEGSLTENGGGLSLPTARMVAGFERGLQDGRVPFELVNSIAFNFGHV